MLVDQQHVSRGASKASQLWRPPTMPGGDEDAAEQAGGCCSERIICIGLLHPQNTTLRITQMVLHSVMTHHEIQNHAALNSHLRMASPSFGLPSRLCITWAGRYSPGSWQTQGCGLCKHLYQLARGLGQLPSHVPLLVTPWPVAP